MLALTAVHVQRMMAQMPQPTDTIPDARDLGRALGKLRRRANLTQTEAAERHGVTPQAWQRYEAGNRQAVLRTDLQARLARAVGSNREELVKEAARVAGGAEDDELETPEPARPLGFQETAAPFVLPVTGRAQPGPGGPQIYDDQPPSRSIDLLQLVGPNSGFLELTGETMLPWGEPSEVIIYDRARSPRRGYGCVVETTSGDLYVKLYNRVQNGRLYVDQLNPAETIEFPMDTVKGVYAVRFRGD